MKAQRPEFVHNGKPDVDLVLTTSLFQLHGTEFFHQSFSLFSGSSFALLSVECLEYLPRKGDAMALCGRAAKTHPIATSFTLERGVTEKTLR